MLGHFENIRIMLVFDSCLSIDVEGRSGGMRCCGGKAVISDLLIT